MDNMNILEPSDRAYERLHSHHIMVVSSPMDISRHVQCNGWEPSFGRGLKEVEEGANRGRHRGQPSQVSWKYGT